MPVDRCVCRSLSFESLKATAAARSLDFEALRLATGCATACSMCEPYIRLMLATGRTRFEPIATPSISVARSPSQRPGTT